jgi:hypothetical protein
MHLPPARSGCPPAIGENYRQQASQQAKPQVGISRMAVVGNFALPRDLRGTVDGKSAMMKSPRGLFIIEGGGSWQHVSHAGNSR